MRERRFQPAALGCAVLPLLVAATVLVPRSAKAQSAVAGQGGRLAVGAVAVSPVAAARTDTVRLDLGAAARLAAERSTAVLLGQLASVEAEARVVEQRSSLLPRLSLDAVHGDRTLNTASFGLEFPVEPGREPLFDPNGEVIGPVTSVDLRGHLSQTLFDWSALQRLRSAQADLSASEAAEAAARQRAAAAGAVAWVQAARAQRHVAAREADVELARELVAIARELLSAGVGVRLDVTRAEAQLASMQSQLVSARAEAERSLLALKRALNLDLDTPVAIADTLAGPAGAFGVAEAVAVADAVEHRADVLELDRRIDAAELGIGAIEAERLPTLSVVAGAGMTGGRYDHLLGTREWALQVSVPIFDGMRRRARLDAQRARLSALEARRRELVQQVAFDVRDALLQLQAARELLSASEARLRLAEEELAQARERFQAGVAGSADVITASLRLNEARTAAVDARAAWEMARVSLAAARGAVTEIQ